MCTTRTVWRAMEHGFSVRWRARGKEDEPLVSPFLPPSPPQSFGPIAMNVDSASPHPACRMAAYKCLFEPPPQCHAGVRPVAEVAPRTLRSASFGSPGTDPPPTSRPPAIGKARPPQSAPRPHPRSMAAEAGPRCTCSRPRGRYMYVGHNRVFDASCGIGELTG